MFLKHFFCLQNISFTYTLSIVCVMPLCVCSQLYFWISIFTCSRTKFSYFEFMFIICTYVLWITFIFKIVKIGHVFNYAFFAKDLLTHILLVYLVLTLKAFFYWDFCTILNNENFIYNFFKESNGSLKIISKSHFFIIGLTK